ncbi:MAG TPA: N-6 DNA methylase, partial [Frankiaceae bacterium]|nr:N-6 DNA methylase [Frankiaceae bacterium]
MGDSLRDDGFAALTAEAVLCNPPYGDRDWGHDELAYDTRWVYGLPSKAEPELAWVQHCLAHLAVGAPAVLLMPPAAAERAAGRRIRAELVRSGALRAVVALPAGAAVPLHVGLHLWLLERPREQAGSPRDVLFVDAAEPDPPPPTTATAGARRPFPDWVTLHATVVETWRTFVRDSDNFEPVGGTARAVPATRSRVRAPPRRRSAMVALRQDRCSAPAGGQLSPPLRAARPDAARRSRVRSARAVSACRSGSAAVGAVRTWRAGVRSTGS